MPISHALHSYDVLTRFPPWFTEPQFLRLVFGSFTISWPSSGSQWATWAGGWMGTSGFNLLLRCSATRWISIWPVVCSQSLHCTHHKLVSSEFGLIAGVLIVDQVRVKHGTPKKGHCHLSGPLHCPPFRQIHIKLCISQIHSSHCFVVEGYHLGFLYNLATCSCNL